LKNNVDVRAFKLVGMLLGILVFGSLALFFYAEFIGTDLVLPWQINVTYFPKPVFLEYFKTNSQPIGFYVDQYINWQHYGVGNMRFIEWPAYALLGSVLLGLLFICTAVTYFKRFWYLVTVGVLILLILQLKIDELLLWGDYGNYLALGILIVGTYFFHAIKPNTPLSIRLLTIGLLMSLFAASASIFGLTDATGLTVISYGLQLPVILALLFMVFVAGENIYSILKVTTAKGGSGKNNLFHFITFGIVYNAILILLFLNKRGEIDFELILINPYLLLIVSAISAYYSFDLRLEKQQGILPLTILKYWVYPILFVCTLTLIVFAKITANDPLVEALEYGIIISHLAMGSAYFVSSFVNFTPLILQNLRVSKVYYKPTVAPNFLIGLVAFASTAALVFYVNFYPYYQLQAGLYNALGDISEYKEDDLLAEQYYKQGVAIDFVNFKSNFQVAKYEKENKNPVGVIQSMQNTFFKNGSGKGFVTLGNYYNSQNQQFNTLFALKEAKSEIISKEVNNNLAFTQRQLTAYDSAYVLLKSNQENYRDELANPNLLALATELRSIVDSDSLIFAMSTNDIRTKSNAVALANFNETKIDFSIELAQDTFLLQDDLFYLFNSSLNLGSKSDSAKINALDYYLSNPYNGVLKKHLLKAKAIQLYELGQVNKAFQVIELLAVIDNQEASNYNFMLGVWALHQNQRQLSYDFFNTASEQGFDKEQITAIQKAVLNFEIPVFTSPVQFDYLKIDKSANIEQLKFIASANAFDETTTLAAIDNLRNLELSDQDCYDILMEAHRINKYSIPLFQEYILIAVDTGLSNYALEGLVELSKLMPTEAFEKFNEFVKKRIDQRRNLIF
jgi:hypothetical protein